jgi:hypothetical protein
MKLHDQFVFRGQRQIGQRGENIAVKTLGAAAGYLVAFGKENNVGAGVSRI